MLAMLAAAVQCACAATGDDAGRGLAAATGERAQTLVYECPDGAELVVRVQGERAWVLAPAGTVELAQVRAASGAKYESADALYWSKGEEALLTVRGETHRDCRNNRRRAVWEDARLRGVDFRAVGNEPGWLVEVSGGGNIRYVGDYGETTLELEARAPMENKGGRRMRYTADDGSHRMMVLIEGERCTDTMSGEVFPDRVTVILDGRTLRGCGRALD